MTLLAAFRGFWRGFGRALLPWRLDGVGKRDNAMSPPTGDREVRAVGKAVSTALWPPAGDPVKEHENMVYRHEERKRHAGLNDKAVDKMLRATADMSDGPVTHIDHCVRQVIVKGIGKGGNCS